MKKVKSGIGLLLSVITVLVLQQCMTEELAIKETRKVKFSVMPPASPTGGRTAQLADVTALLVSVKDQSGNSVYHLEKVNLYKIGNGYVSEALSFEEGSFLLSDFILINASNEVLYATPRAGSPMAQYVNEPLDIPFVIMKDELTYINPEVMAVEEGQDFGYLTFEFNIVGSNTTPILGIGDSAEVSITANRIINDVVSPSTDESVYFHCYRLSDGSSADGVATLSNGSVVIKVELSYDIYSFWMSPVDGFSTPSIDVERDELIQNPNVVINRWRETTLAKKIMFTHIGTPSNPNQLLGLHYTYALNGRMTASESTIKNGNSTYLIHKRTRFFDIRRPMELTNVASPQQTIIRDDNKIRIVNTQGPTEELTLEYNDAGQIIRAASRNPNFPARVLYHEYTYDGNNNLIKAIVYLDDLSKKLYEHTLTYSNNPNVLPRAETFDWLYKAQAITPFASWPYYIAPFMLDKPTNTIVKSVMEKYTPDTGLLYERATVDFNYTYDNAGRPNSLSIFHLESNQEVAHTFQFSY